MRNTLIDVTLWMEGSAEDIRKRINAFEKVAGDQVGNVARQVEGVVRQAEDAARKVSNGAMRKISVGMKNLEAPAAQLLKGLELSAAHAQEFAKNGLTSLKRLSVGSGYGALSLLSLYFLHDSVRTTLDAARETVGARHPEAMAALYGAGVADGVGSFAAANRAEAEGDASAPFAYRLSGFLATGGAIFSGLGAVAGGALLGPLGIGLALGIAAFFIPQSAQWMPIRF